MSSAHRPGLPQPQLLVEKHYPPAEHEVRRLWYLCRNTLETLSPPFTASQLAPALQFIRQASAAERKPRALMSYLLAGAAEYLNGNFGMARALYNAAITVDPSSVEGWWGLAVCYEVPPTAEGLGRAVELYKCCIATCPYASNPAIPRLTFLYSGNDPRDPEVARKWPEPGVMLPTPDDLAGERKVPNLFRPRLFRTQSIFDRQEGCPRLESDAEIVGGGRWWIVAPATIL